MAHTSSKIIRQKYKASKNILKLQEGTKTLQKKKYRGCRESTTNNRKESALPMTCNATA
jgi:hypothetical protein